MLYIVFSLHFFIICVNKGINKYDLSEIISWLVVDVGIIERRVLLGRNNLEGKWSED